MTTHANLDTSVRLEPAPTGDRFDLRPTDEQALVVETTRRFAADLLRPAAAAATRSKPISIPFPRRSTSLRTTTAMP